MLIHAVPVASSTVVVAVDVGKTCVALSVTDTARHRLLGPIEFTMTAPALSAVVERPFHGLVFGAMQRNIARAAESLPPGDPPPRDPLSVRSDQP